MSNRRFVGGSSVILAGWLGATFLKEVPAQRYPKLDQKPATTAMRGEDAQPILATQVKPAALPISRPH